MLRFPRLGWLPLLFVALIAGCGSDDPADGDHQTDQDQTTDDDPQPCPAGYYGADCSNACACTHGAACNEGRAGTGTCTCTPGYSGATCAVDVDDCVGVTCQNGGTCIDEVNAHHCDCAEGFGGDVCQNIVPIASWPFDDDTLDATGNGHDGVGTNLVETTGWARGAYAFATDANVTIPYIDLRSQSFTVEAWVQPEDSVPSPVFVQCENTDDTGHCLWLGVLNSKVRIDFGDNFLDSEDTIEEGWSHLAWVYDAPSSTMRVYINGVLDGEQTDHSAYLGASGSTLIGHDSDTNYFPGTIDEVRLYRAARTNFEILVDADVVLHYDFADGTATDRAANHFDGRLSDDGVSPGTGVTDNALYFDATRNGGAGGSVTTDGLRAFVENDHPFSIELFVHADAATGATLLQVGEETSWCAPFLGLDVDGKPSAQIYSDEIVEVTAPQAIAPNTWTRLTETYDRSRGVKLYVDGELLAASERDIPFPGTSALATVTLGTTAGACTTNTIVMSPFTGAIDDVRIVRRELTADEVAAPESFAHACSAIQGEHPAFTTTAQDVALCGAQYPIDDLASACASGWHVCGDAEWQGRVLPADFDPADPAPPINGPLTSWGASQATRCIANFWEASQPNGNTTWGSSVCGDPYNPYNGTKVLLGDDGTTVLGGDGGCCDWDKVFAPVAPAQTPSAVYCCKSL